MKMQASAEASKTSEAVARMPRALMVPETYRRTACLKNRAT